MHNRSSKPSSQRLLSSAGCTAVRVAAENLAGARHDGPMTGDDNPYPMHALGAQLRAIGNQGYPLAEKALKVAEEEAERKR